MNIWRYDKYNRVKHTLRICGGIISLLIGLFFVGMGAIYIISDFRSIPEGVSGYSGLGLGFMIGSGVLLLIGGPLVAVSIFLFKRKKQREDN